MELPLYQGPQFQTSRTPQGSAPVEHPMADTWQKSAAVTTQTALNFEIAKQERQEYILEQNRSAALQEAAHNLDMEMLQRLQLANGADNSFYDENGILIQSEVDELRQRYLSISDGWTSGFQTEHGMRAAQQAQTKYRSSVDQTIDAKLIAGLKSRAQSALQSNIKASITRGDYDTPITAIDNSVKRGFTSPADAAVMKDDILSSKWNNLIQTTADAVDLNNKLHDAANIPFFKNHPEIVNKLIKKASNILRTKGTPRTINSSPTSSQESGAVEKETLISTSVTKNTAPEYISPAQPPPNADGFIKYHYAIHGYDLKSPEAQKEAYAIITKKLDSVQELTDENLDAINTLAQSLELDADLTKRAIQNHQDKINLPIPEFSPSTTRKTLINNLKNHFAIQKNKLSAPTQNTLTQNYEQGQYEKFTKEQLAIIEEAFDLTDSDFRRWAAYNSQANSYEQAKAYQGFLMKRKEENQEILDNWNNSWRYLQTLEYFAQYDATQEKAADERIRSQHRAELANQELAAMEQNYQKILKHPHLALYYSPDPIGHATRLAVNEALVYQSRTLNLNTPIENLAKAASLPDSLNKDILYIPQNDTSPLAGKEAFFIRTDDEIVRVKVQPTPNISKPLPSVLLQDKLGIFGKKANHLYFQNNIATFSEIKYAKQKTQADAPDPSFIYSEDSDIPLPADISFDENGFTTLFPANPDGSVYLDDGLAPSI